MKLVLKVLFQYYFVDDLVAEVGLVLVLDQLHRKPALQLPLLLSENRSVINVARAFHKGKAIEIVLQAIRDDI